MKKIVVACGSGIVTSIMVANYTSELLDAHGYAGKYEIVRCAITDAPTICSDADMLIATTIAPVGVTCAYISGVPFLTGKGRADAEKQILDEMACEPLE